MHFSPPLAALVAVLSFSILTSSVANAESPTTDKLQQKAQKSDHGLDRDIIRRSKTIPKPRPASAHPAPAGQQTRYGPVLKVKPQGMQPAARPSGKPSFKPEAQKRATSFGVLLDSKGDDDTDNTRPGFAPKPQARQGIEPDEIDVK